MRLALLFAAVLCPAGALAATLTVGPSGDYATIQGAIDAARDGDTIEVQPGSYPERIEVSGLEIAVIGLGGSSQCAITWTSTTNPVFVSDGGRLTLQGFELPLSGGPGLVVSDGLLYGVDLDIHGGDIRDPWTLDRGAALRCVGGTVELVDSILWNNQAIDGGHVLLEDCAATFRRTTLSGGRAVGDGGAIYALRSDLVLDQSLLLDHQALHQGGAVHLAESGSLLAIATDFVANRAEAEGGAVVEGTTGLVSATFEACRFEGNQSTAGPGGAIYHAGEGDLWVQDGAFAHNDAAGHGGAIRILAEGPLQATLLRNRFESNGSQGDGGALAIGSSILADATATLEANLFFFNEAERGGGANLEQILWARGVGNQFCDNHSTVAAGGVRLADLRSDAPWTNNLFVENTTSGAGGALALGVPYGPEGGPHLFAQNTFVGNAAADGGHVSLSLVASSFVNNLFVGAGAGGAMHLAAGSVPTLDVNLWFDNLPTDATGALGAGDLGPAAVFADPLFAAYLADGRCGNDDLGLSPGSPALDAGDPARLDADGSRSDLGATGGIDADPTLLMDADGDGWYAGADCDDQDPTRHPDRPEVCDGVDNDCDGAVDDAEAPGAVPWFPDVDGDGFGDDASARTACEGPKGALGAGGDCDDGDPSAHPGADDPCDGRDNDCDGTVDDGLTWVYWYDLDADGYGNPAFPVETCLGPPATAVPNDLDCDDADAAIHPSAPEVCDQIDNNCDGAVDEGITFTYWTDADQDGYGDPAAPVESCAGRPAGTAPWTGDCDDADPDIHPDAPERCDGLDDDCDGEVDDGLRATWYEDRDGDGYGDDRSALLTCDPPAGFVLDGGDCDDSDPAVHPDAPDPDRTCRGRAGCGCRTAGGPTTPWLALIGLAAARRRRRDPEAALTPGCGPS